MILHPELQIVSMLLQELESTRFLLEKTPLPKLKIQQKINLLEQLQSQLYAYLSNLDYAYHQGQIPYDQYREQQAQLLQNKHLDHYIFQISHLLRSCKEAVL
ncbi:MAG TPA: hypothetical protein VJG90_03500 [Candidatus Nanoarchaeia archaeon]|nr:hypothetical protein [Candidatus Nanoarchaeia archaeon]